MMTDDTPMKTSQQGQDFIRSYEKFRATQYLDERDLPTIGYGHKIKPGESFSTLTEEQAEQLFASDLGWAEDEVNDAVKVDLSQNQIDACVSLCFNIGVGNFGGSTLVRLLNASQFDQAAEQFPRWDHEGAKESEGLLKRREAEKAIFADAQYVNHE
jgi:lysozyme